MPAAAADNSNFTTARDSAVLVHYWRDKATGVWHQTYAPFLERSARADIGVDTHDNLYVASGDSTTKKLHIETASKASDWTIRYTSSAIYYSDPLIDHERLKSTGTLSIFARATEAARSTSKIGALRAEGASDRIRARLSRKGHDGAARGQSCDTRHRFRRSSPILQ